jgi:hypothetical protein
MLTSDVETTSTHPDGASVSSFTAFEGARFIVTGSRDAMLRATKAHLDAGGGAVLIFEDRTGRQVDFDFRGSVDDVVGRHTDSVKPGPGRPRLGVVSREISLLPRQWEWLEAQPNGISAAIRRLVDDARRTETGVQRGRHLRDAAGKIMWAIAGNLPNFEEASRALYARDDDRLRALLADWPEDFQAYLVRLIDEAAQLEAW